LLVTDDFCMAPVWRGPGGFSGALVHALNAGVDLVLIAADSAQIYRALWALHRADQRGDLDRAALERSARRIFREAARPRRSQARCARGDFMVGAC